MTATDLPLPAAAQDELRALLDAVAAEPWAHDFFALLRRIDALRPQAPRTGQARRPVHELLRLGQAAELDFASAALSSLEQRPGAAPRLAVRFFGLLGPQGPMPLHFTEYVRERQRQHGDHTLVHFLDLFHHRLLSLFYRAWAQAQPTVHLDRPADDRYSAWLAAAAGLPLGGQGTALPTAALAYQAGHIASRSRHPEALCKVLQQYFGVPAVLQAHAGQWLTIASDDRSRLGHARNRPERTAQPPALLGRSANAGARVWDRQYKFVLHLGPLNLRRYLAFLPGGNAFAALVAWVRLLAGPDLRWDLQLELADSDRPPLRLASRRATGDDPAAAPPRLGLTTWLGQGAALSRSGKQRRLLRLRPDNNYLLRRIGAPHA
jgi:type VI secretion system protein ImpH